jgi:hypothetical protein
MKDIAYEGPPIEQRQNEATTIPVQGKGSLTVPMLRTFQTDATEESMKTTKLAVLMAEREQREKEGLPRTHEEAPPPHLGRTIFLLLLVLAFGIGVGMYALIGTSRTFPFLSKTKDLPPKERPMEQVASITIDHVSREQLLTNIANFFGGATLADGDTQIVKFTASEDGDAATTSAVLSMLGVTSPPEDLLRSLDTSLVYGIYSSKELVGFFELRSRSYPETFAEMLNWEPAIGDALLPALNPEMKKSNIDVLRGRAFKDERVAGVHARVLSDPDGVVSIAYAFPDTKMLIIAGDREALRALIERTRSGGK